MRVLMQVQIPHGPFNAAVRDGSAGSKLEEIIEDIGPEAVYFHEMDGKRTASLVVDLENASQIPSLAEPFFLTFEADVRFHVVMSPEDLANAGLEELGKKWG